MSESSSDATDRVSTTFWGAAVLSFVLTLVPLGGYLLYPFALIGTWAHEMGHGLAALIAGGSFKYLKLSADLGGVAYHSGVGGPAEAFVAAAGLLAPAVAGGLVVALGSERKSARWVLDVLGVAMVLSALVFVRNPFGFVATLVIGAAVFAVGHWAPEVVEIGVAQFIGVRLSMEALSSVDYMFTKSIGSGDETMASDTQSIALQLGLPYWFWGAVIAAMCAAILAGAYYVAWRRLRA